MLLLEVRDDGVPVDATVHEGTGLQATRQRLQTLFGPRASLTLAPNPQGGTTATIRMPFTEVLHAA
jgi:signal transduction histidine kinase